MNIERTMEFILKSQARAEVRMEKFEARMKKSDARFDARMKESDARVAAMEKRLDRRMDAITKLLQQGIRMLVETNRTVAELAEAQKETDRTLKSFIRSLRNGRNGR